MEVHEDGYKDLMEEVGTYGASSCCLMEKSSIYDVLGVLRSYRGGGIFSSGGSIGKVDGLCVWVKMQEMFCIWIEFLISRVFYDG